MGIKMRNLRLLIISNNILYGNFFGLVWMNYIVRNYKGFFEHGTDAEYFRKLSMLLKTSKVTGSMYLLYNIFPKARIEIYTIQYVKPYLSILSNYINRFNSFALIFEKNYNDSVKIINQIVKAKTILYFLPLKLKAPTVLILNKEETEIERISKLLKKRFKKYRIFNFPSFKDILNDFVEKIEQEEFITRLSEPIKWLLMESLGRRFTRIPKKQK